MAVIEVKDLVVRYGPRTAVDGLSFEADPGQVLGLLGPNGAGKTTTVETLEGYRKPDRGSVRVLGMDPVAHRKRLAPLIGVMLQDGGVYVRMTPRQAISLFAHYYPDPRDPEDLIAQLGLSGAANTPWRRLSGGEKQRTSLALALVGKPRVAFLDEPTAGVDPAGRLTIRQVISDLAAGGTCVILTTHELDEAERLSDKLVIVDGGRAVANGTPSELMADAGGDQIRFGSPGAIDCAALGSAMGAAVVEDSPGEYVVATAATPQAVAALTAWLAANGHALADLRAQRGSLEDVFLKLTKGVGASPPEGKVRRQRRRGRVTSSGDGGAR